MPLCSDCRSEAEFTTTGSSDTCSRCGESCDNCGGFTSTAVSAPVGGASPFDIPTSPGARTGGLSSTEALRDPELAFILGMATMGLICAAVILL